MAIKYAILGFLSWRSLSGYDLKKMFREASFLHWSGNNNQIYRTLLQLQKEGLVTSEVEHRERGPSRKTYTITAGGRSALRTWLSQSPVLPDIRSTFLVQLAWADQLTDEELDQLLCQYEHEVHMQVLIHREEKRRNRLNPARTEREAVLWAAIAENRIKLYENELTWIHKLRKDLSI